MRYIDRRIGVICDQLAKLAVVQKIPIESLVYKEGKYLRPEDADAAEVEFKPFDSKLMHWYGPDRHYWFRADLRFRRVWTTSPCGSRLGHKLKNGMTAKTLNSCFL